jgi:hypothetical protein
MDDTSLRKLYSNLIQINQETFAGAEYNVAYHALSAAAHCAASLKEIKYLRGVTFTGRTGYVTAFSTLSSQKKVFSVLRTSILPVKFPA